MVLERIIFLKNNSVFPRLAVIKKNNNNKTIYGWGTRQYTLKKREKND